MDEFYEKNKNKFPIVDSKIEKNAFVTPCGKTLWSKHVHDYVSYTDKDGNLFVCDGGNEYFRWSVPEGIEVTDISKVKKITRWVDLDYYNLYKDVIDYKTLKKYPWVKLKLK